MLQQPRRLAWHKKLAFNLLMLVGVYTFVEVASLAVLFFHFGPPSALSVRRHNLTLQDPLHPGGNFQAPTVIHPYIGAILQPLDDGGELTIDGKYRITEYGFTDDDLPIHKRSPDRVIVAILGGSVARQFSLNVSDQLAAGLSKSPEFAGKAFKFVRLANNGYKQPQQLMIINYLLMLGAEFDIVINLDGFNEGVLPGIDNVPFGVFSAYPRDWGKMIAGDASPEFDRIGGYITYLRHQQRNEAAWAESFPLCYSPTIQLAWNVRNERIDFTIVRQSEAMSRFNQRESTYCRSGPPQHFNSKADMFQHCTEIWSRSSMLLHHLCAARGTRYFHFMQPNQYLPGSKPIGKEEAQVAVESGNQFGVDVCYPMLKAEGARLAAAGVAFTDFTNLFIDHPEPLYVDFCCHLNGAGDSIMAKAMAERIVQVLTSDRQKRD